LCFVQLTGLLQIYVYPSNQADSGFSRRIYSTAEPRSVSLNHGLIDVATI
jgi:hypothetical protein